MLKDINFEESFSPTAEVRSIFIILSITAARGWTVHVIDFNNVFQTVCMPDAGECHYIKISQLYTK